MVAILMMMVYNIALLVGTVYLIEFHNWNPWWMALTLGLMLYKSDTKK